MTCPKGRVCGIATVVLYSSISIKNIQGGLPQQEFNMDLSKQLYQTVESILTLFLIPIIYIVWLSMFYSTKVHDGGKTSMEGSLKTCLFCHIYALCLPFPWITVFSTKGAIVRILKNYTANKGLKWYISCFSPGGSHTQLGSQCKSARTFCSQ